MQLKNTHMQSIHGWTENILHKMYGIISCIICQNCAKRVPVTKRLLPLPNFYIIYIYKKKKQNSQIFNWLLPKVWYSCSPNKVIPIHKNKLFLYIKRKISYNQIFMGEEEEFNPNLLESWKTYQLV